MDTPGDGVTAAEAFRVESLPTCILLYQVFCVFGELLPRGADNASRAKARPR